MKTRFLTLFMLLCLTGFWATPGAAPAQASGPGNLDLSFGGTGKVLTNLNSYYDSGEAVAIQADGKIVVGGQTYSSKDFALVRYNRDGSLDAGFGNSGIVTTDLGGTDTVYALAIQADGKILAAGKGNGDFALVRYNSDGSLDAGFGSSGIVTTDLGSSVELAREIAIQSDGKIIIAGGYNDAELVRYNNDGSLDASFGSGGKVNNRDYGGDDDEVSGLAVQSDGKIIITMAVDRYDFAVSRLNSDGSLDTSFGSSGVTTVDFFGNWDRPNDLALLPDGKIVAAGEVYDGSDTLIGLIRLNSDGSLDTSFGSSGKAAVQVGASSATPYAVMPADGQLLAAGTAGLGTSRDYFLARFNADGTLDTNFGSSGATIVHFYGGDSGRAAAYSDTEGIVAVAGTARGSSDNDFGVAVFKIAVKPTNPTVVTETNGVADDTWQNSVTTPAFTWSGAGDGDGSGIKEYGVYWGTSSSGETAVVTTTTTAYIPTAVTADGSYYLRLNTINNNAAESGWGTAFTFNYDAAAPANPGTITETAYACVNGGWCSGASPAFTWSGASDGTGSGVKEYGVYWGTSSAGATPVLTVTSPSYTPSALSADGDYYLRLRSVDEAGNLAAWTTVFTYRHDATAPTGPAVFTETTGVISGTLTGVSGPAFTWNGATDSGGSGMAGYDVYFGTNSSGTTVVSTTTTAAYTPTTLSSSDTYYLRLRSRDGAGNTSAWTDGFTYVYDDTVPTNPTVITETNGITSNTWQNSVSAPAFTWSGATDGGNASGVQDYDVYWGTSSSGATVVATTTTAAYTPTAVSVSSEGTYYLRLRTRSGTGATSAWETVFTFKYDKKGPTSPTSATESNGVSSGTWQDSVSAPTFTWPASTDAGSGMAGYDLYWGTSSSGVTVVATPTVVSTSPSALTGDGSYYLRLRARDALGNTGNWVTVFNFNYDVTAPTAPTFAAESSGVISGTWQSAVTAPAFTWSGASDGAGSGIKNYDVYWGTNSAGTTVTQRTDTAAYSAGLATNDTYYLRIRSRDNVLRESNWATLFVFKQAAAPTNPTLITETNGITSNTWQNSVNIPAFTWSGATDGGSGSGVKEYDVYFGTSSSGTTVESAVSTADYTAPAISDGTYYLRLRTRSNNDLVSNWETLFTVKYDSTPPPAIGSVSEGSGVTDDNWQAAVSDPAFTWPAVSDTLSGVEKYLIYWGSSSSGTGSSETTSPGYDPAAILSGTYYLRGQAVDRAGNATGWQTLFTFRRDPTAPAVVLDAPTSYPATLGFTVRWQVTDDESGPTTCTVERQTGGLHSYLANNQPYSSVRSAQHFENLSGSSVLFTATCDNGAGLSTVVTDTTTIVPAVADTDSDEMPDDYETTYGLDPNLASDAAGDLDSDELTNLQEYQYGTSPTDADTDSDGISDYDEVNTLWGAVVKVEANNTDPVDWDTDGDGFSDGWEVSQSHDPLKPDSPYDLTVDTDGDGMPDGWETAYGLNPNDPGDTGVDDDGDGLPALQEFNNRASPDETDTDNDGLDDNAEVTTYQSDPTRWDSDEDGWGDGEEVAQDTNPNNGNDSPTLDDGDTDGMRDSWETDHGLDTDVDDSGTDPDADGLTNLEEYAHSTDPNAADSDGDGFDDAVEIDAGSDPNSIYSTPDDPAGSPRMYLPIITK